MQRILIVDDEPDMTENCRRILDAAGYQCLTTSHALEAVRLLESSSGIVANRPANARMDGMEMLRRAREIDPQMPVVMLTGYASIESAVAAVKAGAFDYLSKSFSNDQLKLTVEAR